MACVWEVEGEEGECGEGGGSCSEMATCPSTGNGDNELQVAGKTNESINGSQHEKVPGDARLIGKKKKKKHTLGVFLPQPMRPLLVRET